MEPYGGPGELRYLDLQINSLLLCLWATEPFKIQSKTEQTFGLIYANTSSFSIRFYRWRGVYFCLSKTRYCGDSSGVRTHVSTLRGSLPSRLEDGTILHNTVSDDSLLDESIVFIKFIPIDRIRAAWIDNFSRMVIAFTFILYKEMPINRIINNSTFRKSIFEN